VNKWEVLLLAKAHILKVGNRIITSDCEAYLSGNRVIIEANPDKLITAVSLNMDTSTSYQIVFPDKSAMYGYAPSGMSLVHSTIDNHVSSKKI